MLAKRKMSEMPNKNFPSHDEQTMSLRRIEGQIRGITKMVEEGKYCVDIINQIGAATNALRRVSDNIFERHLKTCVSSALLGKSNLERNKKIREVLEIIGRMRN